MKRAIIAIAVIALLTTPAAFAADRSKPNIVLFLADDLGWECIGADGGTSYRTPNIDKLAATGIRFDHCNVQPLCTPTRVELMTGLYNVRNYTNFGHMDPNAVTFANLFKKAGYTTAITGKWQLGRDPNLPKKYGFDEYCLWQHLRRPPRYANPGLEINGVEKDYNHGEYGPDIVNSYALDFIQRHKDTPFLLYYTSMLTHAPYQPTPDSRDWDPKAIGEGVNHKPEHFKDMVEYMDKLMGTVVAKLDQLGIRDNTLIIFLGDNGTGKGTVSMMGSKTVVGGKGETTGYGTHVPLVVNRPGKVAPGKVCNHIVDATDFLPTMCDAAGISIPTEMKLDGRSFWPQCRGEKGNPRQWWYCWYAPWGDFVGEFAANARFKLYRSGKFFNIEDDSHEKQPISLGELKSEASDTANMLQGALDQFTNARPPEVEKATQKGQRAGEAADDGAKKTKKGKNRKKNRDE